MTAYFVINAICWGIATMGAATAALWALDPGPGAPRPPAWRYAFNLGLVAFCAVMAWISIALI